MLVLFETTAHNIMRQIRMKTQNMIVLTVEFTRTPLLAAGRIRLSAFQPPASSDKTRFRDARSQKVHVSLRETVHPRRPDEQ